MNPEPLLQEEQLTSEEAEVLNSVRFSRVIIPIIIGIGVVGYIMWRAFQKEDLPELNWTAFTVGWLAFTVFLLGLRHLAYATRLRVLTDGAFTWRKCIELIFIWEFSSAITPTSVGGSGVALFVLSQEKLPAGKIAAIVLYTIILDTTFFVLSMPILFAFLGYPMIYPGGESGGLLTNSVFVAYGAMLTYGLIFFYGVFISPATIRRFLHWMTSWGFLKRFRQKAMEVANDIVLTSEEIRQKPFSYHALGFGTTATAWIIRFVLVMVLMYAFVPAIRESFSFAQQTLIYGRVQTMYVVLALSPTPGGTGIAEAAFGPFLQDFIVNLKGEYITGLAILIAFFWRILTYYFYLLAGTIVLPNWIRGVVNRRKKHKKGTV